MDISYLWWEIGLLILLFLEYWQLLTFLGLLTMREIDHRILREILYLYNNSLDDYSPVYFGTISNC